nr:hypothetical protein [Caldilineaceae bacterium]
RVLRSAVADALLLGALHFAGQYTSRRAVTGVMSEHRWWLARALLLLARVHDGQRITAGTPEELELAVEGARQRVEREGLAVVRYRLPLSRQVRWGVWTLVRVCAQTRTSGRVKKRALQAGVGMGAEPTQIYLDHTLTQWA